MPFDPIAAVAAVDRMLAPGWRKEFVHPPWQGAPPACRACGQTVAAHMLGSGRAWATITLTRPDAAARVLHYSFALACDKCAQDDKARARIAVQVFEPLAPENMGLPGVPLARA